MPAFKLSKRTGANRLGCGLIAGSITLCLILSFGIFRSGSTPQTLSEGQETNAASQQKASRSSATGGRQLDSILPVNGQVCCGTTPACVTCVNSAVVLTFNMVSHSL